MRKCKCTVNADWGTRAGNHCLLQNSEPPLLEWCTPKVSLWSDATEVNNAYKTTFLKSDWFDIFSC